MRVIDTKSFLTLRLATAMLPTTPPAWLQKSIFASSLAKEWAEPGAYLS
jgi:hypothetical protein